MTFSIGGENDVHRLISGRHTAIGLPGWLEKGSSASLLVRYVSQRIRLTRAYHPNAFEANGMGPTYETTH
jgi:hypothetical protein